MGKCKIISHDGDGLYTVQPLPDFTLIDADIDRLTAELSDLVNVEYIELENAYNEKKAETDAAQSAADSAIAAYAGDPTEENLNTVNEKIALVGEALIEEQKAKDPFDAAKTHRLALEKRLERMNEVNTEPAQVQLWCTDLADGNSYRQAFDVDDEAGTIELIGDGDAGTTLQPHYADLGLYNTTRDGSLVPTGALSPASYFYNRAMKPGWQKWRHEFRSGVITDIQPAGIDLTLDDIKSKEQFAFIPVNDLDDGFLTGVSAQYMNCDEVAFSIGDHVIVSTVWTGASREDIVIGFVDNPQPCTFTGFNYHPFVIDGPDAGFHDWQNIAPDPWVMNTPMASDVIADGASDVRDWKGYTTGGDKILVQWEHLGSAIYVNSLKVAVEPNFNVTMINPGSSSGLNGCWTAWVTKDLAYIYAVFRPSSGDRNRFVFRKTNAVELTGAAYNATTAPDGWEVTPAMAPPVATDFLLFLQPNINESGTEGRSLDGWVHGARRTPQLSPGLGTWNLAPTGYDANWLEETVLTITTPSAATLAGAGVSQAYLGKQSDFIYETNTSQTFVNSTGAFPCNLPGEYYWASNVDSSTASTTYSGKERKAVGYDGDTVGYVWLEGLGTSSYTKSLATESSCDTSSVVTTYTTTETRTPSGAGVGRQYTCDFETWTVPYDIETLTISLVYIWDGVVGNLNYQTETFVNDGSVGADVSDAVYRHLYDETWNKFAAYGSPPSSGTIGSGDYSFEKYDINLGADVINLGRTISNNLYSEAGGDASPYVPTDTMPAAFAGTGPPAPSDINTSTSVSTTIYNITGTPRTKTQTTRLEDFDYAKDHDDNYIAWYQHRYNDPLTIEYGDFLTGGDLSTLDELNNGTGTKYLNLHVANSI